MHSLHIPDFRRNLAAEDSFSLTRNWIEGKGAFLLWFLSIENVLHGKKHRGWGMDLGEHKSRLSFVVMILGGGNFGCTWLIQGQGSVQGKVHGEAKTPEMFRISWYEKWCCISFSIEFHLWKLGTSQQYPSDMWNITLGSSGHSVMRISRTGYEAKEAWLWWVTLASNHTTDPLHTHSLFPAVWERQLKEEMQERTSGSW